MDRIRMERVRLCIDIGGTKTAFACYSESREEPCVDGWELFYGQIPTEPARGAEDLAARVFERLADFLTNKTIVSAGIASPGPLDAPAGRILRIATMGWRDVPISQIFGRTFASLAPIGSAGLPFYLLNDCSAGALGEFTERRGCGSLAYLSVSTGVGGGLVLGGTLFSGRGNSAEFGHIRVHGEGKRCPCGGTDCLELYASGTGIENGYFERSGDRKSCAEIAELARSGHSDALATFSTCSTALIEAVGQIMKIVDPECFVFGGGVAKDADLWLPRIEAAFPDVCFERSKLEGKQVLLGCLEFGEMPG